MYNNICLAVRGDSVDARYAIGGKSAGFFTETSGARAVVVNSAQPGMIGSNYIDTYLSGSVNRCALIYNSLNLWDGQPYSFLFRAIRRRSANMGMFGTGTCTGELQAANIIYRTTTPNVSCSTIRNDAGQEMLDQQILSSDFLANTVHDFVLTNTGSTTGNGVKTYLDASLQQQYANLVNASATKDRNLGQIILGSTLNVVVSGWWIEEFVMWNKVIDPTNVILTSGAGSLTGATRTAFVDCPVYDGAAQVAGSSAKRKLLGLPYIY